MVLINNFLLLTGTLGGIAIYFWGLFLGTLYFYIVENKLSSDTKKLAIYLCTALISIFITGHAASLVGMTDPSRILLDEAVMVPFIFVSYKFTKNKIDYKTILGGLILYGIFDGLKPFGINYLGDLPGGLGIVADDLGAALLAAIVIYFAQKVLTNKN